MVKTVQSQPILQYIISMKHKNFYTYYFSINVVIIGMSVPWRWTEENEYFIKKIDILNFLILKEI